MVTLDEYIKLLDKIEAPDLEHLAEKLKFYLRKQKFYEVDLNTRKIEAPPFLSVKGEHEAQVICFKVDRFFENMDLTMGTWVIQYENAKGDSYLYRVPFYDTYLLKEEAKIILPWIIGDPVTIKSGKIAFSLQCYQLEKDDIEDYWPIELSENSYAENMYYYKVDEDQYVLDDGPFDSTKDYYDLTRKVRGYLYNLQTLPAQSQILHSFDIKKLPDFEKDETTPEVQLQLKEIYAQMTTLKNQQYTWDINWKILD